MYAYFAKIENILNYYILLRGLQYFTEQANKMSRYFKKLLEQ